MANTHKKLIEQLQYKGKLAGIEIVLVNDAYRSKCLVLQLEAMITHNKYLGRRVKKRPVQNQFR